MTRFRTALAAIAFAAGAPFIVTPAAAQSSSTPGCQPGNGVFTACFYSGTAFNTFLLQRQDPQINFVWGLNAPYSGGPIFEFSARWQGYFNFNAGSYRFSVSADEGARLYIDGQLVLDRWTTGSGSADATPTLTAGMHLIELDYYNAWDAAYVQLSWAANAGYREFYISPSGNDGNDGRTPATAWATLMKVDISAFKPGDHILFQGGQTFSGVIYFGANSQGTASNPIIVTSYGTGRATIQPGTLVGLLAYNTAGIELSNLNFVGGAGNTRDGVQFYTDLPGNVTLQHIRIDSLEISGFGSAGISIFGSAGTSGFNDIRITNVLSHDNVYAGIWTGGYVAPTFAGYSNSNLYIGNCQLYNNTGTTSLTDSGFGIFIDSTNGAVIEQNVISNNGQNTVSFGGPMGIMAMESNNIVVQANEVHHMHTSSGDGGGIDFDGGVTNSIIQYNYTHENDGSGINLAQYTPVRVMFSGNTVRYNVSQNDGRKSMSWAGIVMAGNMQNSNIYNNTFYGTAGAFGIYSALLITGQTTNFGIRNNVFITAGTGVTQQATINGGQVNMALQGNAYWGSGMPLNLTWNGNNSTILAQFRQSSGQETLSGMPTGVGSNPQLTAPGTGPTFNNTSLLSTLTAYTPLPGSPLINTGLTLSSFGVNPGTHDFLGTAIPQGGAFNIGAIEAISSK
ncbi:MAG: right-handed parallel beta-helix repeat-containing protein [Acidobacteriia bacterium]|nr:right-handed parallel beta-helix repeat-containing protein [Terriglobia bacterium]